MQYEPSPLNDIKYYLDNTEDIQALEALDWIL